ncbi:MAG TPA: hypothetical protein VHU18_11105 [Rhizomicrobium sp.]|jgi:hypothetical protein|nr:hypothetical protein [Rhizomicrobium sp.]
MTKFGSALLALTLSGAPAYCRDWVSDNSFGAAPLSCADWIAHRKEQGRFPELVNRDAMWMFGFLTAMVRAKGPIVGGGMTAEDFEPEIDELCAAHPASGTPAMLELYAIRHKLIAAGPPKNSN